MATLDISTAPVCPLIAPQKVAMYKGEGGYRKPKTKNSFLHFTDEFRAEQRSRGIIYRTLPEAIAAASPHWQKLTHEEKEVYSRKAKQEKAMSKGLYTSTGESIADIEKENMLIQNIKEREELDLTNGINHAAENNILLKKLFCIINTNYYCQTNENKFITCEVAAAVFNLEDGIKIIYHQVVDTEIPLGCAYDATERSKHFGIHLPPIEGACKDYIKMMSDLISLLEECGLNVPGDKHYAPFYAMTDDILPVKSFLRQLCDAADADNVFRVFSLASLFHKLRNKCISKSTDIGFPSVALSNEQLLKDMFSYKRGLACPMHEHGDFYNQCALSRVKRMSFTVCNHCCNAAEIPLIEGSHIPNSLDSTSDMVTSSLMSLNMLSLNIVKYESNQSQRANVSSVNINMEAAGCSRNLSEGNWPALPASAAASNSGNEKLANEKETLSEENSSDSPRVFLNSRADGDGFITVSKRGRGRRR